ncbi:DoxX family protein [Georgenia sp. TF02-10]|uniref:DoxX family protein n=1 Tax=Georgenia sp. TF02-10 TaxID=2917725 RepID=UPI001FA72EB5|nr:DoxX family protein [Georgenia sp. TF02-10]UNX56247.1 DoxX family protein [Georgenia sp. TF02-10]
MTAPPAAIPAQPRGRSRVLRISLWIVRGLLALQFLVGGLTKLVGDPAMVTMFADMGAGQGLRLLVGACEVAGAIGLVIPPLYRLAACGLVLLMVGATATNVLFLQISPVPPLLFGALAAVVAVVGLRRRDRQAPRGG